MTTRILFWILCAGLPAAPVAYKNLPGGTFGGFSPQTRAQKPKQPKAHRTEGKNRVIVSDVGQTLNGSWRSVCPDSKTNTNNQALASGSPGLLQNTVLSPEKCPLHSVDCVEIKLVLRTMVSSLDLIWSEAAAEASRTERSGSTWLIRSILLQPGVLKHHVFMKVKVTGVKDLQHKLSLPEPLAWYFPELPTEAPPRFRPHFDLKIPEAADSVSVTCGGNLVHVEVKRDLLGTNRPVQAADLKLGSCPAAGEDPRTDVVIFEAELHRCGSELLVSEDFFTYIFMLHYTPTPLGSSGIVRTTAISIRVECHYQRRQDMSLGMVKPTWKPLSVTDASQEHLPFSLQLMTDDWQFPRQSGHFVLEDMMKFEASVKQFHHTPLRVTVDSCVATTVPNTDTVPRYAFLGNHGCLFDSQLTDSRSRFLPQTRPDKLRFEMGAFVFQQDAGGPRDLHHLPTDSCSSNSSSGLRPQGCTFSDRWQEASASHDVCSCCDTDCGTRSHASHTWHSVRP
ncbi:zona pellucida sperm-binding protein 3-like [Thalassophryne amazonica]|uniref:zona pellucida sperm-binding protein 3-like n=1 Tax=Thalassophryne amazonica TaxID=390379 RepID=UPI0014710E58|nr:zona pellucida sperm-binding protein 3-like [Thalassophryne amazonica]